MKSSNTAVKNDVSNLTKDNFERYIFEHVSSNQCVLNHCSRSPFRQVLHEPSMNLNTYFTFEAFEHAVLDATNQIFICHEKGIQPLQAMAFVQYAAEKMGVQLTPDVSGQSAIITLSNGATMHFVHADAQTIAGHCADVYIGGFYYLSENEQNDILKVARGVAFLKTLRITCFSSSQNRQQTIADWEKSLSKENLLIPVFEEDNPTIFLGVGHWGEGRLCADAYLYLTSGLDI